MVLLDAARFEITTTPIFYSIDPVEDGPALSSSSSSSSSSSTGCGRGAAAGAAGGAGEAAAPQEVVWVDIPCDYTRHILLHAIARRRPRLRQARAPGQATVLWCDYEDLDWDRILDPAGHVKANSYLVRKGLGRKAQLAYQLRKYLSKRPESPMARAVPETLVVETWEAFEEEMSFGALGATFDVGMTSLSQASRLDWCLRDVKERMEREAGKLWILKPSVTNKGAEVHVAREYAAVREVIAAWPDVREWVLQSYVDRPLLFQQKKFHIRTYVLAVGDLAVYVWRRMLLLSSAVAYDPRDIGDPLAHITNTYRQAEGAGAGFQEDACVHLLDDLVEDLREEQQQEGLSLAQARDCVEGIKRGIQEVTGELFRALQGERTVFAPMPQCFELFGLDFLVSLDRNEDGQSSPPQPRPQVHLLEVNPGPDFKQSGHRLRSVIQGLLEATLDLAVLGDAPGPDFALAYEHQEPGGTMRGGAQGMRLLDG